MVNLCPVCGYHMAYPPSDYHICPSCGTEFGYDDAGRSHVELRKLWLLTGPKWWSPVDPQPPDWNPLFQISDLISWSSSVCNLLATSALNLGSSVSSGLNRALSGGQVSSIENTLFSTSVAIGFGHGEPQASKKVESEVLANVAVVAPGALHGSTPIARQSLFGGS
jgi:hypothetical protein